MSTVNKAAFLQRTQQLAGNFIAAANEFYALTELLSYADIGAAAEQGGLDDALDFGNFPGLTRDGVLAFYVVMGALLSPLTPEQKRAIYGVAR